MKKAFVFCVGGTGIRVMKSIIMLMASGMDTNGYTIVPIVFDPHLDLEENKNLVSLIDKYRNIHEKARNGKGARLNAPNGFFHSELTTIAELNSEKNDTHQNFGSQKDFRSYIDYGRLSNTDINSLFVKTLFSKRNLDSKLSVGFKGNPNMGTVVLGDIIEGDNSFKSFKSLCEQDDRVFIISSIFGGTGASGYPLLEKKIRNSADFPTVKNAVMGAVTVLPYYGLKDPETSGSDIDSTNFYTKTKAALAYYEKTVQSDLLYYVGEQSLKQVYENNEDEQKDTTHFVELVAASALFDFLGREKPKNTQYLTRSIEEDKDQMTWSSLGGGYTDIVKSVADYMMLRLLTQELPTDKYFPLRKNLGLNAKFYNDADFADLRNFTELYFNWYDELSNNKRAFAPLQYHDKTNTASWIKDIQLDAPNYTHILLEMIKQGNKNRNEHHGNKLRYFLEFAYKAVNKYTEPKIK